jgi:UDP-galactopyranose mutase
MSRIDLVCLGDRPWVELVADERDLLARAARDRFVFYWEPARLGAGEPRVALEAAPPRVTDPFEAAASAAPDGVMIATPHLPRGLSVDLADAAQRALVDDLCASQRLGRPVLWYRAPEAFAFTRHLRARAIVYERVLGPARGDRDALLARRADVVLDERGEWDAVWARVEAVLRARRSGVQAIVGAGAGAHAVQRRRRTSWR